LIAFYPFGYPDLQSSLEIIEKLSEIADLVEIGLPFTDPTADGPTIQGAYELALKQGASLSKLLQSLEVLRLKSPALIMSYANPVFRYGIELLSKKVLTHGIVGFIIPDLPVEEKNYLLEQKDNRLPVVLLASPIDSPQRIEFIARSTEGFLYLVTSLGVTGVRDSFDALIFDLSERVKSKVRIPIAAGFGISSPNQVRYLAPHFEAFIVGSAIIKLVESSGKQEERLMLLEPFLKSLKEAGQKP
jgi:tryptophan synthase alpha chain